MAAKVSEKVRAPNSASKTASLDSARRMVMFDGIRFESGLFGLKVSAHTLPVRDITVPRVLLPQLVTVDADLIIEAARAALCVAKGNHVQHASTYLIREIESQVGSVLIGSRAVRHVRHDKGVPGPRT